MNSETFYDAPTGQLSAMEQHPHRNSSDKMDDEESSFLPLSPRPQYTTTASSSTLRQDALDRDIDLHHRASSSTLLGAGETAAIPRSSSSKRRPTLPPARPSPNMPLPPRPTTPPSSNGSSIIRADDKTQGSSQTTLPEIPLPGATELGPSGTIRGRPRGATIGTVPGGKVPVKQRIRPRSMLCNEWSSDGDAMQLLQPEASSSSASSVARSQSPGQSSSKGDKTASSTSDFMAAPSLLADTDDTSRSSIGMTRTPSSSANSSSMGVASSSAQSGEVSGRSRSGSNASLLQQVQIRSKLHASFVIAVVGHQGSGKSGVIKKGLRQFGLSKPNALSDKITSHSTICIVDHEQRTIEVLEMDATVLLSGPSKRFAWPAFLPHIDAVILCYDASQMASFRGMSELLENFAINSIKTIMLACKSEIHPKEVDPFYASDVAHLYNIGLAECSVKSEEGRRRMRDCFSFLVKEVAKKRAANVRSHSPVSSTPLNRRKSLSEDMQETLTLVSQESSPTANSQNEHPWRQSSTESSPAMTQGEEQPVNALQESIHKAQLGLQSAKTLGGYVSVDELWDKVFYAAVSGNDERFLLMFMVFYRGFAKSIELLRQLIARFEALARGEGTDVMIRYSLMRLTTMLGDWMQEYPGDLSGPETYPVLCDFFQRLLLHPSTMHIASPLQFLLETVRYAPDVDALWSRNQDNDKPRSVAADVPPIKPSVSPTSSPSALSLAGTTASPSTVSMAATSSPSANSSVPSTGSNGSLNASSGGEGRSRSDSTSSSSNEAILNMPKTMSPIEGRTRSQSDVTASSDGHASGNSPSGSSQYMSGPSPYLTASPQLNDATATGNEQKSILRSASNALFDIKEEAIALELTRIEWDLFTAVGSRDLLRHILVSRAARSPESPVARSIAHFNYISFWTCSMILIQSKIKLRAKLLEKFMEIAGILRRTNNYNSLHAVLAGLANASIHRLNTTRDLLKGKPVMKVYLSLARLMGSDRSFAAYRLALENSEGRTIPYLGVHLQDILSISDGNPSKRSSDNAVHWRKFYLMDEAVMTILRCQQFQEPLRETTSISKLILNLPIMDEDTLFQRSLQVEPRGGASGSAGSRIMKIFHVDP